MKRSFILSWFLLTALVCFFQNSARAIDAPPIVNPLKGSMNQLVKGANNYIDLAEKIDTSKIIKPVNRITNIISFYLNEDTSMYFSSNFIAKVKYHLYYKNASGTLDSLKDQWLEISYRGAVGDTAYEQRKSFYFYNASYTKIVVDSFYTNVAWNVKPGLILMNEMRVNLDYKFECTINGISTLSGTQSEFQNDELNVSWAKAEGADEYDLEWSYIDSSALNNYKTGSFFDPNLVFENNATRVTVHESLTYRVPLLYDGGGILFYRVRPVQNKLNGKRIEGTWATSGSPGGTNWYYSFAGHQLPLNWQASTSFAEDGKRKSVVQYFDGTLRSRQTVTKDNTTQQTVVAETFYDHQGRPVIQVLPAPTLNTIIAYTQNFNRMNTGEYDKSRYDTLLNPSAYCNASADTMSVLSGASQYYSPRNPKKDFGVNKFIPDAKGYPFTETQYTADNTGRISKQSGVGPDHKMGSGHETKYYYGTASQREIDALFGTEVGNYTHYFKNMVRDANGQYSVSYVDMKGRTIATALAGKLSDSIKLDDLPSYTIETITEKLVDPASNTIKGLTMEASKGLIVTKAGNHRFQYSLLPDSINIKDCNNLNICYDCYYDLEVTISGDCNNQLIGGSVLKIKKTQLTINKPDTSCSFLLPSYVIDTTFNLPEGSYLITKKLTISKFAADYYRDSIFLVKNLCTTKEQFIQQQIDSMRLQSNCEITCSSCLAAIGTWETFRHNYMLESGYLFSDTASHRNEAWAAYQEQSEICDEICEKNGLDDDIRHSMLADVTAPNGQYADPEVIDGYSIFHSGLQSGSGPLRYQTISYYTDENGKRDSVWNAAGNLVPPTELSIEEFANNFKASWADSLLRFHPEYCYLATLKEFELSNQWDIQFLQTETFAEAKTKKYINPSAVNGVSGFKYNQSIVSDPLFIEPLYIPAQGGPSIQTIMNDKLRNFVYSGSQGTGYISAWSVASQMAKCKPGDQACASQMIAIANAFDTTIMCEGELDMAWRAFREIYYKEKQAILFRLQQQACGTIVLSDEHEKRFMDPRSKDNDFSYANAGDTTAAKNRLKDSAYVGYVDNCTSYAEKWLLQLAECKAYDTSNLRIEALPHLINVCVKGSDTWHPFGSSSISPDSSYSFNSFQDVIRWYNLNHNITDSITCNVYAITNPPAYGQQSSFADKPIWNKPDSCDCARITELNTKYLSNQSAYSSFADYMLKKQGTVVSNGTLDSLLNLCNGTITCNFLSTPLVLPPSMQCGVKDVCADCITVDSVYQKFKTSYPSVIPVMVDAQDTIQQTINKLFANYMNNRLGFSFDHSVYLQFLDSCRVGLDTSTMTCTDLERVKQDFYYTFIKPASLTVDYDLRTLAGNWTPEEGPKGVFDVNGNLIGNTVSGTVTQIKNSYAAIWNSNASNSAIGTLGVLPNGKFRLTLNPGQAAPCNGIVGMRYYQFNFSGDTLDAFSVAPYSYVDFGDGLKERITQSSGTFYTWTNTVNPSNLPPSYTLKRYQVSDNVSEYRLTNIRVAHFYPNAALRTVTVYHTDTLGIVGFSNIFRHGTFMSKLSKLRGYFPQDLKSMLFFSTQDTTFNTTDSIYNFNSINSVRSVSFGNYPAANHNPATAFTNNNFKGFANNTNLNAISYTQGGLYGPAVVPGFKTFDQVFPNLPQNFPNLSSIGIGNYANYSTEFTGNENFSLPKLRHLNIGYGLNNMTNLQLDSIIIQVARSHMDSGQLVVQYWTAQNPCAQRTSLSDAAYNSLVARGWNIALPCHNVANSAPGYNTDTVINMAVPYAPYKNAFTDYFNQSLGLNLAYYDVFTFLQSKCGTSSSYCAAPTTTIPPVFNGLLCGKSEPIFAAITDMPEPCADSTELGITKGTILYEAYRDSLKNAFDEKYLAKCLQAYKYESFTVTRPVSEFHYTLYYYDQAGNLVKTVPPAGVQPIYRQTWLDSVANYRAVKNHLAPLHKLYTTYRYNTLNQVVAQKTPDAGISNFWYDRLGRLAISQNAKQFAQTTKEYSYTLYDALGRIKEVGLKPQTTAMTNIISRDTTSLKSWLTATPFLKQQITSTVYDQAIVNTGVNANITQRNLRNRVSYTMYWEVENNPDWNSAVFYSYDIHGNVDTLLNDYGSSLYAQTQNPMNLQGHRWKKLVYRYDLISGKVNHVAYQPRQRDAIYHRYEYDAENRLVVAEISTDSLYWEKDAKYEYYRHGPLARTVLGHQNVQGLDYAYTLQGWLKGVNGTVTNPLYDMGRDGQPSPAEGEGLKVARDVYGFSLYYHGNDYTAINDAGRFEGLRSKLVGANAHRPLFNGNISAMAVNIAVLNKPVLYNYTYDQLNRIKAMDVFNGANTAANLWSNGINNTEEYKEAISYDANGNILRYLRQGMGNTNLRKMDSLSYIYKAGSNKLSYVRDKINGSANYSSNSTADVEDQVPATLSNEDTHNYRYDEIGNLVRDSIEGIRATVGGIKWNVYGKITEINKVDSSSSVYNVGRFKKINYYYDASGNRIGARFERYASRPTYYNWYVRDAGGNVMAVYKYTDSLYLNEQHLYGSSRLGIYAPDQNLERPLPSATSMPLLSAGGNFATFTRAKKFFELSNHLGNVLVSIRDTKRGVDDGVYSFVEVCPYCAAPPPDDPNYECPPCYFDYTRTSTTPDGTLDYYTANVASAQDYFPFGMKMPGRSYSAGTGYRYGFNGKEEDDEASGDGNQYDYGFRIYNPRLGRFLSMDPLSGSYPWYTPYQFAGNKPIWAIDLDGLEEKIVTHYITIHLDGSTTLSTTTQNYEIYGMGKTGPLGSGTLTQWITEKRIAVKNSNPQNGLAKTLSLPGQTIYDAQFIPSPEASQETKKQGPLWFTSRGKGGLWLTSVKGERGHPSPGDLSPGDGQPINIDLLVNFAGGAQLLKNPIEWTGEKGVHRLLEALENVATIAEAGLISYKATGAVKDLLPKPDDNPRIEPGQSQLGPFLFFEKPKRQKSDSGINVNNSYTSSWGGDSMRRAIQIPSKNPEKEGDTIRSIIYPKKQ
jgi:RHS repeat-associated protein